MKFGINLASPLPRPWNQNSESELFRDAIKIAILADELGFDYLWIGEHHFLEEYHHISAAEVFMGALAMATRKIRLAHGIMTLQPKINHPVRVAERIACEDLFSGGRIDFGTGRGSGEREWGGFGIEEPETRSAWDESLRAVLAMWQTETFSWDGKHFKIPERNVVPKPLQKPHPPLWLACTNPGTQRLAGERGLGSIAFLYAGLEDVAERVKIYREGLANPRDRFSDRVNDCFAFFPQCVVDKNEGRARQIYLEASQKQREVFATRSWLAIDRALIDREVMRTMAQAARIDWEGILEKRGSVVGSVERAIDTLHAYAEVGIDMTVFNVLPGITGTAEVERNLRVLAEYVLPEVRKSAPDEKGDLSPENHQRGSV
jgi:alkanesulfonate monooxygenase SsuD/methylene tetrahydromethanopterin reductase-like flavin-dependent oxidoreductase (luciferase family)